MLKSMLRTVAITGVVAWLPVQGAHAAVALFQDRATFEAEFAVLSHDTFNDITTTFSIDGTPFDRSGFSVLATSGGVRAPPLPAPHPNPLVNKDIDGTAYLSLLTSSAGGVPVNTVTFTFDRPILGFGVQFDQYNDNNARRNLILLDNGDVVDLTQPSVPVNLNDGDFLGWISDTPFTSFEMQLNPATNNGDGFSLDNVVFAVANIPAPGTIGFFLALALVPAARHFRCLWSP